MFKIRKKGIERKVVKLNSSLIGMCVEHGSWIERITDIIEVERYSYEEKPHALCLTIFATRNGCIINRSWHRIKEDDIVCNSVVVDDNGVEQKDIDIKIHL